MSHQSRCYGCHVIADVIKVIGSTTTEHLDGNNTRRNLQLSATRLESTHGCKHPSLDSGATPIGSAGRATNKNNKGINNRRNSKKNGPEGSNKSKFKPGDLNQCRVTLFCLRQLTSIGLPNKTGLVTFIPYVRSIVRLHPKSQRTRYTQSIG